MNAPMKLREILDAVQAVYAEDIIIRPRVASMFRVMNGPDSLQPISVEIFAGMLGNAYNKDMWKKEQYDEQIVAHLGRERAEEIAGDTDVAKMSDRALGIRVHKRLFQSLAIIQIGMSPPPADSRATTSS